MNLQLSEPLTGASGQRLPALSSQHLSALIAVADSGSFSEAALRLGVAQSSVSYAVKAVEKELGVQLFERGRYGARLTPAGSAVLEQARLAAAALRAMLPNEHPQPEALCGLLRVASCRSVIRQLLTPSLSGFRRLYPHIQVVIQDTSGEHDEIEQLVLGGQADLGLGRLPMRPELRCQPLFADEYLIVAAAHAPRLTSWEDFHRAPYIVCEEDCAPHIADHIARHSRPPMPAVRLKDAQVALGMVAEEHGFTVLTRLVVAPLAANLQAYPLPTPLWRSIGRVTSAQTSQHPLIRAFEQAVLSPKALRAAAGPVAAKLWFAEDDSAPLSG
ncbi:LysR family transcriptional regulator [Deinococcus psychrotolerans]|uniref:LysR family transcriptional regulator n=1 Tax=Deinococcus psychrotolerans TaxID=2489213 RepID=A0A3G8YMW7_9DEIO|nr:LysR family transcriptional regulator [Deinococcus psychrotolerans]AZI42486.1 LysR family transcriptional regulator [Deinococcus psychrotolerans]